MNVVRRSKDLKALLDVRTGPGAAIFPGSVKRLHLDFAFKYNEGHFGARKLWREHLPRLKYFNPTVSMTVSRHGDQNGHSKLTVFYSDTLVPTTTSAPSPNFNANARDEETWDRTETIDMKHKDQAEILQMLLDRTGAEVREMSEQERSEKDEAIEDKKKRDRARQRQEALNERARQERALLQQAKESAG